MTPDQFQRELSYRVSMALAKNLLRAAVIDDADYSEIDTILMARFRPILAGLYPKTT